MSSSEADGPVRENEPGGATPAVQVDRLSKRYEAVTALDDVSLSVAPGRFLVLLGPSGSGKSTLIRCLAGIESPSSGSIAINGKVVAGGRRQTPPERRDLTMVFQDFALWPHMTVEENVAFALRRRKTGSMEAGTRARAMLQRVGPGAATAERVQVAVMTTEATRHLDLTATAMAPLKPGTAVQVMLRPTATRICSPEARGANLRAVVRDGAYHGRGYDYVLELGPGITLTGIFDRRRLARGETVGLHLDPNGALAFEADASINAAPLSAEALICCRDAPRPKHAHQDRNCIASDPEPRGGTVTSSHTEPLGRR